jgi:REP-associated tyrosine transposase
MTTLVTQGKRERLNYEGAIFHITTRCNNKSYAFNHADDFSKYLFILDKCKEKYGFKLFNYVLMNNHVHLLLQLIRTMDISRIMHAINRWFAFWYNRKYNCSGHFWEERFYANSVTDDMQILSTMIYMDANPIKAKLCKFATDWQYSGALLHVNGITNTLIDIPQIYLELGEDKKSRRNTYNKILELYISQFMDSQG